MVAGLATLVTLALRYAGDHIDDGTLPAVAQTDGYALSFRVGGVVLMVVGGLETLYGLYKTVRGSQAEQH